MRPPTLHPFLAVLVFAVVTFSSQAQTVILDGVDIVSSAKTTPPGPSIKSADGDSSQLLVVQFTGPTRPEWLRRLESNGATVHHYLADYAYIVTMNANALDSAKRSSEVAWVGTIPAAAKISGALAAKISARAAKQSVRAPLKVLVLSYGDAAATELEASGVQIESFRKTPMGWHETRLTVPASRVFEIAQIDCVFNVEEVPVEIRGGERAAQAAAGPIRRRRDRAVRTGLHGVDRRRGTRRRRQHYGARC